MRKLLFTLVLFGFLSFTSLAVAIDIGSSYHITCCHNTKLVISIINLWSASDGGVGGAKIVARVSGGNKNEKNLELKCQGTIVKVLDIHEEYIKVQSIDGKVGWVANCFIGEKVK